MLQRTSRDNRHRHMLYVSEGTVDERGQEVLPSALMSTDSGHTHEVVLDEATGQFVVAEMAGHSHMLEELVRKEVSRIPKQSDSEKVGEVMAEYTAASQHESDSLKAADESVKFYQGDQWDNEDLSALKQKGRQHITMNEIKPLVDMLMGYQRQNRSDYKFFPIENGDSRLAEILDELFKNIMENNEYVFEESLAFLDQVVPGRGIFHTYVDYDTNILGKIVIERYNYKDVKFGPHDKLDLSDCEYLVKQKMYSKAKLKQLFPDKADEISIDFNYWESDKDPHERHFGRQYVLSENKKTLTVAGTDGEALLDITKKEYKLLERWRRQFRKSYVFALTEDSESIEEVSDLSKSQRKSLESIPGAKLITRNVFDMRITKVAGTVLLSDEIADVPYNDFDITVAHANRTEKKWWGKVDDAKDVQREINKRRSQFADILNRCATYGWWIDKDTFRNPADEKDFMDNGSHPGFVGVLEDLSRPPIEISGQKMPNEIVAMEQLSSEKLHKVMNIPMEMQAQSSSELSGRAIIEKRRQGLVANEFLFDNLNLAKKLMARKILALVQEVYTPERVIRLIRNQRPRQDQEQAQFNQMEDEEIVRLLEENWEDLLEYDVHVGQSAYSETVRSANFEIWMQAMNQGFPFPPEALIEMSDLPNKEKVLGMLSDQKQAEQQEAQATRDTEIQKTQIAHQPQGQPGAPQ